MTEKNVPPKTVTAFDVARLAGVSQSTVSRVFNPYNTLHIRDKTRKQVLQAAEALGYSPNAIAKTMASGRTGMIGIVVPSTYNLFHYHALQELASVLKQYSLHAMVITAEPTGHVNDLLRSLSQYQVDGAVITSAVLGQNATGNWNRQQMPVVLFNSDLPGAQMHTVQCDHFQGGVQMANHLVEQGYRRFAYVTAENSVHLDIASRKEGFFTAYGNTASRTAASYPRPTATKAVSRRGASCWHRTRFRTPYFAAAMSTASASWTRFPLCPASGLGGISPLPGMRRRLSMPFSAIP